MLPRENLNLEANLGLRHQYYKHWFVHVMMIFWGELGNSA